MRKQRLFVLLTVICLIAVLLPTVVSAGWEQVGERWLYIDKDGNPAEDFEKIDGVWYFFEGGLMVQNEVVYSAEYGAYYAISEDGESHWKLNNGWNEACGAYYYIDNGVLVTNEIRKIGGAYYAFYDNGAMAANELFTFGGVWCYARKDGTLLCDNWHKAEDGVWFYFGKDGLGVQGFNKIGGVWYFFIDGVMQKDMVVWSEGDNAYLVLSEDGTSYQKLKAGWNLAFDQWYYLPTADTIYCDEAVVIDGVWYYFRGDCKLVYNAVVECEIDGVWGTYVADGNGVLRDRGWATEGGNWHYVDNGIEYMGGIYEIEKKLYAFDDDGVLYTVGGELGDYYVTDGTGVLYVNQWRDRLVENTVERVYYGEDGRMLRNTSAYIDKVLYVFDWSGKMVYSDVYVTAEGIFIADQYGICRVVQPNTWEKIGDNWYYAGENYVPADGLVQLKTDYYYFENGLMITGPVETVIDGVPGYYLFNDHEDDKLAGKLSAFRGWNQAHGEWYYVQADGTLAQGWQEIDGHWFYLSTEYWDRCAMKHDCVWHDYDAGKTYYFNGNGVGSVVEGEGLVHLGNYIFFLKNNVALTNGWHQVDGSWYYFGFDGAAYVNGVYPIGANNYYFDQDGKMLTGWFVREGDPTTSADDEWYCADANGALLVGKHKDGDGEYLFDANGMMLDTGAYEYDGKLYLTAVDGKILGTLNKNGWTYICDEWYYTNNNELYQNCVEQINGFYYGFDHRGVMQSNGIRLVDGQRYVFGWGGEALTGWHLIDGIWVYGNTNNYEKPFLWTGVSWINGDMFVFTEEGFLQMGTFIQYVPEFENPWEWYTELHEGYYLFQTDDNGVVTTLEQITTDNDGWIYAGDRWFYVLDGKGYTGWVNEYFVNDGAMVYLDYIEYNGEYYYFDAQGQYLQSSWFKTDAGWVYANDKGELACNEWVLDNGKYYFFDGIYMLQGTYTMIDGVVYQFDASGAMVKEIPYGAYGDLPLGLKDASWYKDAEGNWYYYYGGVPVAGEIFYNGNFYYFDWNTYKMVTNGFAREVNGAYNSRYYFGEDGAAVAYTGWQYLDGEWYFFRENHKFTTGLLKDSKGWNYAEFKTDSNGNVYYHILRDTYKIIDGVLFIFDSEGVSAGAVVHTGWYQYKNTWFYFTDGSLCRTGYRVVNGSGYYFENGKMVADAVRTVFGLPRYFEANGLMAMAEGWYQTGAGKWVYVNKFGYLYNNGIYYINGVEYTFSGNYWKA